MASPLATWAKGQAFDFSWTHPPRWGWIYVRKSWGVGPPSVKKILDNHAILAKINGRLQ